MAVAAVVWTSSAQSGRRRSDSEADKQAHTVSVFFQFVQNKLDLYNRNGCLILLPKFPIFARGYIGIF
jgi:hypothetical protein